MPPRLRVLAGPSPDTLAPISDLVNSDTSHTISSELFKGEIAVYVKGFTNAEGEVLDSQYFDREDRQGVTWSIQVQGRFLHPHSADDILFGNTFDRPLKLPWGSGAALKFMKYIDPTLEHDLSSTTQPWALSPLISTMPNLIHTRIDTISHTLPPFPPSHSIGDDTSQLHHALFDEHDGIDSGSSTSSSLSSVGSRRSITNPGNVPKAKKNASKQRKIGLDLHTSGARRSYFNSAKHRNEVVFGPNDLITTDFCYGFLEFSPTISLRLPGGVSFDLMKYWDGQPVRFVCCERRSTYAAADGEGSPWGRMFWCVAIELAEQDVEFEETEGIVSDDID